MNLIDINRFPALFLQILRQASDRHAARNSGIFSDFSFHVDELIYGLPLPESVSGTCRDWIGIHHQNELLRLTWFPDAHGDEVNRLWKYHEVVSENACQEEVR